MKMKWVPVTTELHPAILVECRGVGEQEETVISYNRRNGLHLDTDLGHLGCAITPLRWNAELQQYECETYHGWKPYPIERPAEMTKNQFRLMLREWAKNGANVQILVNAVPAEVTISDISSAIGPLHSDFGE